MLAAVLAVSFGGSCLSPAASTDSFSAANTPPAARARVVIVKDMAATHTFEANPERVCVMVGRAVTSLTGKPSVAAAWRSVVNTQDVVGLKVHAAPGPTSGTRPAVVAAVVEGLLAAGLPATNIVIWDKHLASLRFSGYPELAKRYGVRVAGSADAGYDDETFYDTPLLGSLIWGDFEFGQKGSGVGRKSYVSKLVSRGLTKIINVTPLLNHNSAGVTGNLYGLAMGSVDNTWRFESEPERLAQAVPEIYALPAVGDRVVLNLVDALLCQYQGSDRGLLHYTTVLNEIRVSRDPVALDVLSLKELDRQRQMSDSNTGKVNLELYKNASLLELGVSSLDQIDVQTLR